MPKKILIIEDEADLSEMLGYLLKASGYRAELALDGLTGVKKAKEERPDLIILDLAMPKMNGFQVADELKKDDSTKNIPIIILTAVKISAYDDKIKAVGAVSCVTKPFENEDLLAGIRKVLGE